MSVAFVYIGVTRVALDHCMKVLGSSCQTLPRLTPIVCKSRLRAQSDSDECFIRLVVQRNA